MTGLIDVTIVDDVHDVLEVSVAVISAAAVVCVAIIGALVGLVGHMLTAQGKRIDQLDEKVKHLEARVGVADRLLHLACRYIEHLYDHHCDPSRPYPDFPDELRGYVDSTVWMAVACDHPVTALRRTTLTTD